MPATENDQSVVVLEAAKDELTIKIENLGIKGMKIRSFLWGKDSYKSVLKAVRDCGKNCLVIADEKLEQDLNLKINSPEMVGNEIRRRIHITKTESFRIQAESKIEN